MSVTTQWQYYILLTKKWFFATVDVTVTYYLYIFVYFIVFSLNFFSGYNVSANCFYDRLGCQSNTHLDCIVKIKSGLRTLQQGFRKENDRLLQYLKMGKCFISSYIMSVEKL